ncbi:MAG: hypothetical protein WCX61_03065 [Candidatus Peribacteraceae bacterium]
MIATSTTEASPERLEFFPTPRNIESAFERVRELPDRVELKERIADMDAEHIAASLQSAEGQAELIELLTSQQDTFREAGVDFRPEELQSTVALVGATLKDEQDYDMLIRQAEGIETTAAEVQEASEQQPGIFRRALNAVGGFAKHHPIVTSLLVAGLVATAAIGSVALAAHLAGGWSALMTKVGLAAEGAALGEVGGAMDVMEPVAEGLSGAGAHAVEGGASFMSP